MEKELYHFGIKGMRWGVRRFQNSDGSLTSAGKERYNGGDYGSGKQSSGKKKKKIDVSKAFEPSIKGGKDKPNISPAEKVGREAGNIASNASKILESGSAIKKASKGKQSKVNDMSDQELRDAINRLNLERTYESLTAEDTSSGMAYANEILAIVGSVTGIAGSVAAIISTINAITKG